MTTVQEEAAILRDKIEREGIDDVSSYINERLDQWRNEPVYFAVTGASNTGKSSFINSIRNLKPGDIRFAKSSPHGDTTPKPTKYDFPEHPMIKIFDLPGFGTTTHTIEGYETKMQLVDYDYFFIFIKHVEENDITCAKKLQTLRKPFCFIRSKFDQDLANCEYDEESSSNLKDNIKERTIATLKNAGLSDANFFVISNRSRGIGEFDELVTHIEDSLCSLKREVIIYSLLGILTGGMIERKYQELQKRVIYRSVGTAACAALPLPGFDLAINMGIVGLEIEHYKATFGFDQEFVKKTAELDGVRERIHKNSLIMIANDKEAVTAFVLSELGKVATVFAIQSALDPLLPVVGSILSACTAGIGTYRFLNRLLDRCRADAKVVYSYLMDKPRVRGIIDHGTTQENDT